MGFISKDQVTVQDMQCIGKCFVVEGGAKVKFKFPGVESNLPGVKSNKISVQIFNEKDKAGTRPYYDFKSQTKKVNLENETIPGAGLIIGIDDRD